MFRDPRFVLVVAVAVALWFPLTQLDWFLEFEFGNYVVRSVEWAQELRAGHLYPRWSPDMYGGYGEPLFVFFAPAIYSVTGLLTALSIDPVLALKFVALCGSLLAGTGTYALVYGETRNPDAALLSGIAYLAAPYRLGDLFERGDFGEFCCIALLPVVLALYLAASREARPFRARGLAACASLVHAVMILTHTILGLWGTALTGLVILIRCVILYRAGAWRRVPGLVVALGCAPGLAGAYVVPAMAYRGVTHSQALVEGFYRPQNHFLTLSDLFTRHSYLFEKNFTRMGPFIVIATVVTVVGAALKFKHGRAALPWMLASLALLTLTLPVGYAFWEPGRLPLTQFIQFPWRLLGPAALTASVALGIGAAAASERLGQRLKTGLAIAGSTGLLLFIAWPYATCTPVSSSNLPRDPDTIRSQILSGTSADEFLPEHVAAKPRRPRGELVSATENASVARSWSDGSTHSLALTASKPAAVVRLAHYGFPGWNIRTRSGPTGATLDTDDKGMLSVHLPSPGEYQLEIAYGQPPLAWLGFAVTGLSLLTLGLMLLRGSSWWPYRIPAT
ncbi:MAG: 6-pyruvoyl-tetrahydropterin synthase-related protein [Polyangiaceae bacterium]